MAARLIAEQRRHGRPHGAVEFADDDLRLSTGVIGTDFHERFRRAHDEFSRETDLRGRSFLGHEISSCGPAAQTLQWLGFRDCGLKSTCYGSPAPRLDHHGRLTPPSMVSVLPVI